MDKFDLFFALFFAFMTGYSAKADWTTAFGTEYAVWVWLYFTGGHLCATIFFVARLLLSEQNVKKSEMRGIL